MKNLIYWILVLAGLTFVGYKYFEFDQNQAFQKALKEQNIKAAEAAIKDVVSNKVKDEAKKYVTNHNGYAVSKTNDVCVSLQKNLGPLKTGDNPIECTALVHTFTYRIKTIDNHYYCADTSGFYTTELLEPLYKSGVSCK